MNQGLHYSPKARMGTSWQLMKKYYTITYNLKSKINSKMVTTETSFNNTI